MYKLVYFFTKEDLFFHWRILANMCQIFLENRCNPFHLGYIILESLAKLIWVEPMDKKDRQQLADAVTTAGIIGLNMVATIIVGLVLGRLLDDWLGIRPWATVGGIVLGMLAGLWAAFKRIMSK